MKNREYSHILTNSSFKGTVKFPIL